MKQLAVIAACLLLAGCAFRPMYGRSSLSPQLASVYVEPVAERDGYELRNRLIDLLQSDGDEAGKKYHLKIALNEASQGVTLQNDATITRYNQSLEARYTLTDAQGNVLTSGTESALSAYNVVQSPYATLAASQDSSMRAAQDMAERIQLELGAWFRRNRK